MVSRRDFLKWSLANGSLAFLTSIESGEVFAASRRKNSFIKKKSSQLFPEIFRIEPNYAIKNNLEAMLKEYLTSLTEKKVLSSIETPGFLIYDIDNNKKIAGINETLAFQCASMVKPLVALAYFDQVQKGHYEYTTRLKMHMAQMIQISNNSSTNFFFELLGGPTSTQSILETNYPHIFSNLHIVETIPEGGKTYQNKASLEDYNRFLCALWKNELPYSQEIMYHMSKANKSRNIVGTNIPENQIQVYNKTGTTSMLYGDMGIFNINAFGINKTYTQIGLFEREIRCPENLTNIWKNTRKGILRGVTEFVYQYMKQT